MKEWHEQLCRRSEIRADPKGFLSPDRLKNSEKHIPDKSIAHIRLLYPMKDFFVFLCYPRIEKSISIFFEIVIDKNIPS